MSSLTVLPILRVPILMNKAVWGIMPLTTY